MNKNTKSGRVRQSEYYVSTFVYQTEQREIAALRKRIKAKYGNTKRVVLQGRLGPDNPNRQKYLDEDGKWPYGLSAKRIKLADSGYVDAYVYNAAAAYRFEDTLPGSAK